MSSAPDPPRHDVVPPAAGAPAAGSPAIRASDAERERAMEVLRDAATEGRLSFEELADRIEAAATATTRGELEVLAADLPTDLEHAAPAGRAAARPTAGPSTAVAVGGTSSVFGDVRRSGSWRVPERSHFSTTFGDIELDLREAIVAHPRVEIHANAPFGNVTLLVPEGVVVEVRTRLVFGDLRQQSSLDGPPGAPVVVLTGSTVFGDVRIVERRLRERLLDRLRRR